MKNSIWMVAILLGLATACQNNDNPGSDTDDANIYTPIALSASESQTASNISDFAFRFFSHAINVIPNDNLILSPLSASMAMAMTGNGASGEAQLEIVNSLSDNAHSIDEINALNEKLVYRLPQLDRTATMGLANSFWSDTDFPVKDSFISSMRTFYNADVFQTKLSQAASEINNWCAEKTNNLIPEAIKDLDEETNAVIVNALYFKGKWKSPFSIQDTKPGVFANSDGSETQVDMMSQTMVAPYQHNDLFCTTELPYGNEAYSLQIVLPNKDVSLQQCVDALNASQCAALRQSGDYILSITIPKFEVSGQCGLKEVLNAMGISKVFEEGNGNHFSMLTYAEGFYLKDVIQLCDFSLDEHGTEAASVTITTGHGSNIQESVPVFLVNRPFLFLLKEHSTGAILFIGKVERL